MQQLSHVISSWWRCKQNGDQHGGDTVRKTADGWTNLEGKPDEKMFRWWGSSGAVCSWVGTEGDIHILLTGVSMLAKVSFMGKQRQLMSLSLASAMQVGKYWHNHSYVNSCISNLWYFNQDRSRWVCNQFGRLKTGLVNLSYYQKIWAGHWYRPRSHSRFLVPLSEWVNQG